MPNAQARRLFRRRLLAWYDANRRDLPWRKTRDPYEVLVSEIMLHQTQVDRVIPKYHEFLAKYPTLKALAGARAAQVKKTWYPLGYNIRPLRLHSIAREAVARYGGRLPDNETDLLAFKGIGRYTAGAVMTFAFGKPRPILDTNVMRVLYRLFVGRGDMKSTPVQKQLWEIAAAVLPRSKTAYDFNQALMDFGAMTCTAQRPKCALCPMLDRCLVGPL